MATSADLQLVQQAILRKKIVAEADLEAASGTTVAQYEEQLIERAETSTEPVLIMTDAIVGKVPTEAQLNTLAAFAQAQFDYYSTVLKVANPELGPYEALGRALSSTTGFHAQSDGKSDGQFIVDAWVKANGASPGTVPSDAVVQHYQAQITFFTNLYKSAGIAPAEAANQARGAVFGQIIGMAALVEDGPLDTAAENFMRGAVTGAAIFDAPLSASQPAVADPNENTVSLTQQTDSGAAFSLGTGNDTFNAEVVQTAFLPIQTLNSTDNLDGGAGRDTLNAQLVNLTTTPAGLKSIEVLNIDGAPGFITPDVTLNVVNADSIDTIGFRNTTSDVTVTNLKTKLVEIDMTNEGAGLTNTITAVGTALAGTADEVAVKLNNVGQGAGSVELHLNGTGGYETIDVDSAGGIRNDLIMTGTGATHAANVNVTGDTDLNLDSTQGTAFDAAFLKVLDASALTGALNTDVAGTSAAGTFVTVKGGSAGDDLTFGAGVIAHASGNGGDDVMTFLTGNGNPASFTSADSADGGEGNDTLRIQADTGAVLGTGVGANITGVETIQHFTNGNANGNLTVDFSHAGSANVVDLAGNYNGFDVSVDHLTNTNVVEYSGNGLDDLTLVSLDPDVQPDIVNLHISNGSDMDQLHVANNVELLNLNVTGTGTATISDASDINTDISLTGDGDLSIGGGGGFDAVQTIDGHTYTGNLEITLDEGHQTLLSGSGDDIIHVTDATDSYDLNDGDLINISTGGKDLVAFEDVTQDAGNATDSVSYHHIVGFSVADDVISVLNDENGQNFVTTQNATAPNGAFQVLDVAAGTFQDGRQQGSELIKFTAQVNTAGDSVQSAFVEAIGNGGIQTNNNNGEVLAAFYDATHSQMVLIAIDIGSSNQDANPIEGGTQAGVTAQDDVDVVATVGMSYQDFLAFNGTNLHINV